MRFAILPFLLLLVLPTTSDASLPEADAASLGFDAARLELLDGAVRKSVDKGDVPGAVVLVGRRGKVAFARAVGSRALEPEKQAMTRDTIFDMASLTKPIATATSVMILVEQGKIRLGDRLGKLMPEFDNHGKGAITVEQLLRHRSGLLADNALSDYADGPDKAWERLAALPLQNAPGERFLYSDVNFIILGRLVEKLSGQTLDVFAREHVFEPLGLRDTGFRRIGSDTANSADRIAPTEKDDNGSYLRGVVHDPRSRALGGVAGHAGLFSTADDVAAYAQMLLNGGRGPNGARVLGPLAVRMMTDAGSSPENERRGLGWDLATGFSAPRGALFGPSSFGHTGFTGTSLWIDPETETFVVLLTSRLHPDGKRPSPTALRAEVATLAAAAIVDAPSKPSAPEPRSAVADAGPRRTRTPRPAVEPVECGIDVLIKRDFAGLKGKRVGLVTNHTGRTRSGTPTIDVLYKAPDVKLVALFSPEHGIRGLVDAEVSDSKDEATGLPIHSLYGKTRKPTPESLEGLDILVYDIQDIGARFYTYISTLGLVLEAAKDANVAVMVLDRPNPIGGVVFSGPVRDDQFASFIAHHALPVRHGMTVGELAKLFNAERNIGADLTVVTCEGWRRANLYDRTDLVWVNPSPNMRSLTEALLYPGVALLEATNLATGRGTDEPFERVGAPWVEPRVLAADLNKMNLPGVRFVPIRFTPKERQYAGKECGGVQIVVTDFAGVDPMDVGLALAVVLRARYPDDWKADGLLKMIADQASYDAILAGRDVAAIKALWGPELAEFGRVRAKYLLYR